MVKKLGFLSLISSRVGELLALYGFRHGNRKIDLHEEENQGIAKTYI